MKPCLANRLVAEWRPLVSAGLVLLTLAGCASGPQPERSLADAGVASCQRWYADLDALVQKWGVNDAQDRRIGGFPQLRQSRFSSSFRQQARHDDEAFDAWFSQMRDLGDQGSALEIANLPDDAWRSVFPSGHQGSRAQVLAKTQACAERLSQFDRSQAPRRASLLNAPGAADSYSTLARVLGAYALTRWPFAAGVNRWQEETLHSFSERIQTGAGAVRRYVPEPAAVNIVAGDLVQAPRDALGVPVLSAALSQRLLERHAPIVEIAPEGAFDEFGEMAMDAEGRPRVVSEKATVYRRVAFARQGDATLVQLMYLYWFSERPRTGPLDLLGGALDGVMWRVTLDEKGQPLVYDSAHACGCYHLFFPTAGLRAKPAPEEGVEWAFVPARAPSLGPGERVVLGLAPRTHYLRAVSSTADFAGVPYQGLAAARLRSMPVDSTSRRSLYGPDGIVAGTQRGERYFFWPMGVRDAGAQRQWGHHATAFVGRRHFDDPFLIEQRFERAGSGDVPVDQGEASH